MGLLSVGGSLGGGFGSGLRCLDAIVAHVVLLDLYHGLAVSIGLGLGGILNIALDPLFMFVILEPGKEVLGAGIATMISNIVALVYFTIVFFTLRKRALISVSPRDAAQGLRYTGEVLKVGFPSALGTMLACVSNVCINNLVSSYGDYEMAAVGIVKKIDMLPLNVGMGLCQGMMPLVAYNFSAGNYKRMRAFTSTARLWGIAFSALCIVVFEIFAEPVVRIFINEAETVKMATDFLRIMCLAVPLMITNFQLSFTFQAMGCGKESLLLSSLRQGVVNIPLLFLMNHFFGLYGIIWTQLISDIITTVISFAVYNRTYKRLISSKG